VSLAREWDLEGGLPRIGTRLPLIDQDGLRHGTVEVERVSVTRFDQVDADVIAAERPGSPRSVEEWQAEMRTFWDVRRESMARLLGQPGWELQPSEPMAAIWFRVD
jgi:uncharacterized protein YhfF